MRHAGFTLIESVLALFLVTAGTFGLFAMFQNSLGGAATSRATLQATWLARQRLEQIAFDRAMHGYSYVVNNNYPASETLTGDFSIFTRATTILEVSPANLTTASNGSGYKRATVTITWPGSNSVQMETLVTSWGAGG